jgi:hypothetical protein
MEQVEQRRAGKGGEFGANGEWYKGGAFIATKDNPKSEAQECKPASEWSNEWAEQQAVVAAWSAPRLERFGALLAALDAQLRGSFMHDMGYLLRAQARLTERQAECVVKFWLGRRVKANAAQWDALLDDLCQEFQR